MAKKFIVNAFQCPNSVVDNLLSEMSGNALKVYLLIIRQTIGWSKDIDTIALSKIVEKTGLKERTVQRSTAELLRLKLIRRNRKFGSMSNYSIVMSASVKTDTRNNKLMTNQTQASVKFDTETNDKSDTLQKTLFKYTITKEKIQNLDYKTWNLWCEYRANQGLKKYTTDNLAIRLATFTTETQILAVNQSIEQQWKSLFPENIIKNKQKSNSVKTYYSMSEKELLIESNRLGISTIGLQRTELVNKIKAKLQSLN